MLRLNTYAKPCLGWFLAAIIAMAPTADWADGSPPFVVTTLPAAVVHALPPLSSRAAPGPARGDFVLPPEEARATNLRNCADVGHGNGSVAPSDSNGAVGKNNIVAVTGAGIGLYDKSSCLLVRKTESLESFFGISPGGPSFPDFPRALYDAKSKRFFVTAAPIFNFAQYFAVSTDETGTRWFQYKIQLDPFYCPRNPDPTPNVRNSNVGFSDTRWFLTGTTGFGIANFSGILSIDKAASLKGASVTVACFAPVGPSNNPLIVPPIVMDKSPIAQFLSDFVGSTIPRTNLIAASTCPNKPSPVYCDLINEVRPVTVPGFNGINDATQPNGRPLSAAPGFQSPSIQAGGFIWNVHTIGINGYARIRLYKLDTSASVTTPLLIFTPKTTPENEHLFNASFATSSGNPNAPAFITATRTIPFSSTKGRATTVMFAGLNSSSRDTVWSFVSLGQSPAEYTIGRGGGPCPCLWGNYSATQVDPSNPKRAWGFSQLATGVNETDWTVRAGEVERSEPKLSLR